MIDVTNLPHWPTHLEPKGWADGKQPPFDVWWAAVQGELGHLGEVVAEQWPYRHWEHSFYAGIPFDELSVRSETWDTEAFLENVHVAGWQHVKADHDYQVFYERPSSSWPAQEPGRRMLSSGTWRTPVLLLETPNGIVHREGTLHDVRYLLIEGHCRHRCLNALHHKTLAASVHSLLILSWTTSSLGK